ncbi:MAG: PDZ domain-containing protein [Ruminococcaceae bacterium]|nr:PDZ domain-containing protein [Oscillospiraceae bacterium]
MKQIKKIIVCLLAMIMLLGSQNVFAEEKADNFEAFYFDYVYDTLIANYKFEANTEAMAKAIAMKVLNEHPELLEDMLDVTSDYFDKHTDYMTKEEMAGFTQSFNGEYVGIGISVIRMQGTVEVESVFTGGPAEKAGIRVGDRFLKVGSTDVSDYTVNELVELVRGEAGTKVQLTLGRGDETIEVTVTRAAVQQNSVSYKELEKGLGYLYISVFNEMTPAGVKEADEFFKLRGITKVVIDLRDNPGGDVYSVVESLGYFVPQGKTVVSFDYRIKERNSSLRSVGDVKKSSGYKLAVLIDGGSASGAELFAGNIRDYKLGKLIGSRTYGKGTMQEMLNLLDNEEVALGNIKLTTAEFVLPGGDKIHGVGIQPDFYVVNRIISLNTDHMEPMEFGLDLKEGDSGKAVLAVKQRFSALGYAVGEVDEQFDHNLTLTVKTFQEAAGLPKTGIMDMDTETLFSSVVSEARVLMDDQLDRAIEYLKTGK